MVPREGQRIPASIIILAPNKAIECRWNGKFRHGWHSKRQGSPYFPIWIALAMNWGFTHLLKSCHITTAAGGSRAFRKVHHKQGHDLGETWGYNQSLTNLDPKNVAETTA